MAKKKKIKKKKSSKHLFRKLLLTLIIIAGIILVGDSCGDRKIYNQLPDTVKEQIGRIQAYTSSSSIPASYENYGNLLFPERLYDREEQIINHTGFSVSYNEAWRLPNWTSYELTREKTNGTVKRARHFKEDPHILGICAKNDDYSRSGYDRGHMVPAADMKWSEKAMQESFYFSNICPQTPNLNSGNWKELEEKVRNWAQRDSAIIIITGPILRSEKPKRIGVSRVAVPEEFFKVILSPYSKKPNGVGFIMPNRKENKALWTYAVTIDDIESITGINFFPTLSTEQEKVFESMIDLDYWGL